MQGTGNCCCTVTVTPTCVFVTEIWSITDTTSLGTLWVETSGDWKVVNQSAVAAGPNYEATCQVTYPNSFNKYYVAISTKIPTVWDTAQLKIAAGTFYTELQKRGTTRSKVRLFANTLCVGSVETDVATDWFSVLMCADGNKVDTLLAYSPLLSYVSTVGSGKFSIATGSTAATVWFDSVQGWKHTWDTTPLNCITCWQEGCPFFSDTGPGSSTITTPEWTVTGDCRYSDKIQLIGQSKLVCAVPSPYGAKGHLSVTTDLRSTNAAVGDTMWLKYENTAADTGFRITKVDPLIWIYNWRMEMMCDGKSYGPIYASDGGPDTFQMCWDGTIYSFYVPVYGYGANYNGATVPGSPTTLQPTIEVKTSASSTASWDVTLVSAQKNTTDLASRSPYAGCQACHAQQCECADGTFHTYAKPCVKANGRSGKPGTWACSDLSSYSDICSATICVTVYSTWLMVANARCGWSNYPSPIYAPVPPIYFPVVDCKQSFSGSGWTGTSITTQQPGATFMTISSTTGGYCIGVRISSTLYGLGMPTPVGGIMLEFGETVVSTLEPVCDVEWDGNIPPIRCSQSDVAYSIGLPDYPECSGSSAPWHCGYHNLVFPCAWCNTMSVWGAYGPTSYGTEPGTLTLSWL